MRFILAAAIITLIISPAVHAKGCIKGAVAGGVLAPRLGTVSWVPQLVALLGAMKPIRPIHKRTPHRQLVRRNRSARRSRVQMALVGRPKVRREMTAFARLRRRIQQLGPYPSLLLLIAPLAIVEPAKLLALLVAGKGHWLSGTAMIVLAYAAKLLHC